MLSTPTIPTYHARHAPRAPRAAPHTPRPPRPPARLARLPPTPYRLAEDAVKMAIKDYQSKQEGRDAVAAAAAAE